MAKEEAASKAQDPKNRPAADNESEDEDVFHDARFPAEEEAVSSITGSWRALSSTYANSGYLTETFERVACPKGRGKQALRCLLL